MTQSVVRVADKEIPFNFDDLEFDKAFPGADTVILSTMCANVAVIGLPNINQIRVAAKGNKSTELKVQQSGSEIMISAPLDFGGGMPQMGNISFGSSSGVNTINGVLYIDGRSVDTSDPMLMLVVVPLGTKLKVGMVLGKKVVVRKVNGALDAKLIGTTNIEADIFTSAKVHVSGTGSLLCETVTGEQLDVKISGMGGASVKNGKVNSFRASVSGMGNISFGGEAVNADLSVSGMGSVYLATCSGTLSKSKSGMGSITISNDQTKKAGKATGFDNW